jgi:hypothetical protein
MSMNKLNGLTLSQCRLLIAALMVYEKILKEVFGGTKPETDSNIKYLLSQLWKIEGDLSNDQP